VASFEQVADGIYRLGTDWVGWYLCEVDGSLTVVDCGFPAYFEQLPAALSELGHPLDAVAAVVLTHYHPDHAGAAERIRNEAGATVFAPAEDAAGLRSGKVPMPGGLAPSLWRPAMMRYMAHAIRNGGARLSPVKEVLTYGDGDVLDAPGALRAVHTPGHTGGHCSLLAEGTGVLFAGDALATLDFFGGPPGPQLLPLQRGRGSGPGLALEARGTARRRRRRRSRETVRGHAR
jgi:glyoxylase-like metal-dependent hydrolase (beta-lactamase superfamily II)